MGNIPAVAIARGAVIEYGIVLAVTLGPIVKEGIDEIYGIDGVQKLSDSRVAAGARELRADITTWSINDVVNIVDRNWRPVREDKREDKRGNKRDIGSDAEKEPLKPTRLFESFFVEKYRVINSGEFRDDLRRLRFIRDNAAHPEFGRPFTIEEGKEFFTRGERVLRSLRLLNVADTYRDRVRNLEALEQLKEATSDFDVRSYTTLERYYPREYETELTAAEELWITGTNLRRIVSEGYLKYIEDILSRGGVVKVLMHHPTSDACRYAMIQDRGPASDIAAYRQFVHGNLMAFCKIRATNPNGKNLLIRTIDYMLTFGLDIINGGNKGPGTIYVRFYPLPRRQETLEDRPIIRLNQEQGTWYDFFKGQFERHWSEKSDGGLAEDLPEDYAANA